MTDRVIYFLILLLAAGEAAAGDRACQGLVSAGDAAASGPRPDFAAAAERYAEAAARCGTDTNPPALRVTIVERRARAAFALDQIEEAERYLRQALRMLANLPAADDAELAQVKTLVLTRLAAVRQLRGDKPASDALISELAGFTRTAFGADSAEHAKALIALARSHWSRDEREVAAALYREALHRATKACEAGDCSAQTAAELALQAFEDSSH